MQIIERAVLQRLSEGPVHLDRCSEEFRQVMISLGMREPPLCDVDGPRVSITQAGRQCLAQP